jgi:hypothetical protein
MIGGSVTVLCAAYIRGYIRGYIQGYTPRNGYLDRIPDR